MSANDPDAERLRARIDALPGVAAVREAAAGLNPHLVGGAVRDLMRGAERADVDVVVEGDALAVARRLDPKATLHERFGTAKAKVGGAVVDLAGARAESYPHPGALPVVRPGRISDDLARRDFTVNAMAVPLEGAAAIVDPYDGARDLATGALRVLHQRSFVDDPTRALRGARYAARLDLAPDPETERLLRATDLGTVSAERVEAELRLMAAEPDPAAALALASEWAVLAIDPGRLELSRVALGLLGGPSWGRLAHAGDVLVALASGDLGAAESLAAKTPARPSEGTAAAHGSNASTLLIARALGAEWLDDYVCTWRDTRLEIGGADLMAAGVEEGPAVGRGLDAALRAKLDGETSGRDDELRVALAAADGT